jgi:RNA polymerase sigma-70 factor (ECF subfamily)
MPGPSGPQAGGDHFEALYRESYKAIFAYVARRIEDDTETVADLVAEVFVVALRKHDAVPPPPEDRLWLYGVARRVVLDYQQRHRRQARLRSRLTDRAALSQTDTGHADLPRLRVQRAIQQLRPGDREVLHLVAWDGLSYTEAGHVLGCTANAVALRLHKAKARLRRILSASGTPDVRPGPVPSQFLPSGSGGQI